MFFTFQYYTAGYCTRAELAHDFLLLQKYGFTFVVQPVLCVKLLPEERALNADGRSTLCTLYATVTNPLLTEYDIRAMLDLLPFQAIKPHCMEYFGPKPKPPTDYG